MTKKQVAARQAWLRKYEALIVSNQPQQTGKIDWDTAIYFYQSGLSAEEASVKTLAQIWGE